MFRQKMLRVRANGETFRETMFPQQCSLVCGGLYVRHEKEIESNTDIE